MNCATQSCGIFTPSFRPLLVYITSIPCRKHVLSCLSPKYFEKPLKIFTAMDAYLELCKTVRNVRPSVAQYYVTEGNWEGKTLTVHHQS